MGRGDDCERSLTKMPKADQRGEFDRAVNGCLCSVSESTGSVFVSLEDKDFNDSGRDYHESDSPSLAIGQDGEEVMFPNSEVDAIAMLASRSSAHNSNQDVEDSFPYKDLEQVNSCETEDWSSCVEYKNSRARSPPSEFSTGAMQSNQKEEISYAESLRRDEPTPKRAKIQMPSRAELDEFFDVVEQQSCRLFSEKYNFDFESEKPFDGRYEWVRLTP